VECDVLDMLEVSATIFFAGDVMAGRGVDQILPHPADPQLNEPYIRDAREYVKLVEARSGTVPKPVPLAYVWGDALGAIERADARVVNLETSITRDGLPWPDKEVCYRMHPSNVGCLTAAHIDACALANNHVLDWGEAGLRETLDTLRAANVLVAGAGGTRAEAQSPAIVRLPGDARLLVFSIGSATSDVRASWGATDVLPGVDLVEDLSEEAAARIAARVEAHKRARDVVVASIHWGTNYGWDVPETFVRFAHALIEGGVDVVHGHSSHHPRGIEVHRGKLVLYGCGDLLNDYEALDPDSEFRIDLALAYFATIDVERGTLSALRMMPLRIRKMRLERASSDDATWLATKVGLASERFGSKIAIGNDGALALEWT
jgi:poly-gamma-glutamate capsule biosynthesis protein CapA/YwtB (metallophosphatase superfamily)